jgi:hypothetical protein
VPAGTAIRAAGAVADRPRDDAGGVWIRTGIVLGVLFFAFMVVLWAAGFDAIAPFVVIPIVLVALIGANSLLGGPRKREQLAPRPIGPTDRGVDPSTAAARTPEGEQPDRHGTDTGSDSGSDARG